MGKESIVPVYELLDRTEENEVTTGNGLPAVPVGAGCQGEEGKSVHVEGKIWEKKLIAIMEPERGFEANPCVKYHLNALRPTLCWGIVGHYIVIEDLGGFRFGSLNLTFLFRRVRPFQIDFIHHRPVHELLEAGSFKRFEGISLGTAEFIEFSFEEFVLEQASDETVCRPSGRSDAALEEITYFLIVGILTWAHAVLVSIHLTIEVYVQPAPNYSPE
ncbi:unnamed protein product [Agarophyton chilense]